MNPNTQNIVQSGNCVSRREHFNYLRNNSCGMSAAFTYGNVQSNIQDQRIDARQGAYYEGEKTSNQGHDPRNRRVSFDEGNRAKREQSAPQNAKNSKNVLHETNQRKNAADFTRKSKIEKDHEGQRVAAEERRQKVQNYIDEQKPYSRGLSNSKFQQYFNKAAPECYGRANTNEPIGGIIYGNHLKTFNTNPHAYTNQPEYLQTHTTALNYGKRTKLSDEERWKKLERELSKKLGLKDKNQTLKEGKEVVYVDVDDSNMYQAMRENHEFQKANRDAIHERQVEFKKEKHQEYLDDINEFYAQKQSRVNANASKNAGSTLASDMDPEEYEARLNQQMIYRHHDKNGNVRLGADRHALTCFVDMNFPENDAIYTEELKNRMPIYATKAEGDNINIDEQRRQNYFKSKEEPYPSHYLLRNCEEPEVLKMISEKSGGAVRSGRKTGGTANQKQLANSQRNPRNNNKSVAKNFASTANTTTLNKTQKVQNEEAYHDSSYNAMQNKSEILKQAWKDPQLAGDISKNMSETCCVVEHLPHNEKNPQCYRNTHVSTGKIPFAG